MITRAWATLEIKSIDEEKRTFEGVASTPQTDRGGDRVDPMGAVFKLPLPMMWQHGKGEIKDPVGWIVAASPNRDGIPVRGQMAIPKADYPQPLKDQLNGAWVKIRDKIVRGLSIGFSDIESEPIKGSYGTHYTKWEWLELSPVAIPMNADASIQTIKSIDAKDRAALGVKSRGFDFNAVVGALSPGASGKPGAIALTGDRGPEIISLRKPMKSFSQQLAELNEARATKQARIKELSEGCGGDVATLAEEEVAEYDQVIAEVKAIDVSINRVKGTMQAIDGAHEVPTDAGTDPEKGSRARSGLPYREPKAPPLEKGIALAQYLRLMGRAKGNVMHAFSMAQGTRGLDPRVPRMLKTAVEGGSVSGTTTAGNWGMELVGSETSAFADFVDFLRPQTILGRFGTGGIPNLRRVPFRVPLVGMTDGGAGYWVGEGKSKPLTKFAFSRTHLEPLKVAAICVATRELIMDSSPAADGLLRDALAAALREREDTSFIDPDFSGSAGVSPDSITKNATPIPATGTGDAADVRTDIKNAFGQFIAANNAPTSGVWIMSSRTALATSLMMNPLGQPDFPGITMNGGTLSGLPVITSEYVPDDSNGGTVVLINAQDVYFGDDGGITIDTSEHASLLMDTAPTGMDVIQPADAQLVSMYQTNSVAYRAERRLDWMLRRDSAVVVLSGVNWGAAT